MTTIRTWGTVVAWAFLCVLSGPLWVGGFSLAWLLRGLGEILRWAFWEPTQFVWHRLVGAYRRASAKTSPAVANELERQRKGNDFARRARRARRGL
jgi:hypothetical protein